MPQSETSPRRSQKENMGPRRADIPQGGVHARKQRKPLPPRGGVQEPPRHLLVRQSCAPVQRVPQPRGRAHDVLHPEGTPNNPPGQLLPRATPARESLPAPRKNPESHAAPLPTTCRASHRRGIPKRTWQLLPQASASRKRQPKVTCQVTTEVFQGKSLHDLHTEPQPSVSQTRPPSRHPHREA